MDEKIEIYKPHPGTLKIAGGTIPKKAGICAYHYFHRGITPIDFFVIGANANQQAMKAMGVFKFRAEEESRLADKGECPLFTISFAPLRFHTVTENETTHEEKEKDAVVWRTVITPNTDTTNGPNNTAAPTNTP